MNYNILIGLFLIILGGITMSKSLNSMIKFSGLFLVISYVIVLIGCALFIGVFY